MLTRDEHKEMLTLSAKCLSPKDWETPLPDAGKKELGRLSELLKKMSPEPADEARNPRPERIKNFVMSEQAKLLLNDGAEFQGVEVRNHGTDEKPRYVYREWLYVGAKGSPGRKAVFVQYEAGHQSDGKVIEAGRTIADAAYRRFSRT